MNERPRVFHGGEGESLRTNHSGSIECER